MYAPERQSEIEQVLLLDGRVSVLDLAARFAVTTETIRRDLAELERRGSLTRVHGGAVAPGRSSIRETSVGERLLERSDVKSAIAKRALTLLAPGFDGSIFVDAGSTTAALADALPHSLRAAGARARVVTHSLSFAPMLAASDAIELTLIGGRIRSVTAAAVGAQTVAAISNLRPDVVYMAANGISSQFGLSTPDPEEAAVKRAIVASGRRVVLLCDATKFERELLVGFARLDDLDVLVTDAAPAGPLADALEAASVEVLVA